MTGEGFCGVGPECLEFFLECSLPWEFVLAVACLGSGVSCVSSREVGLRFVHVGVLAVLFCPLFMSALLLVPLFWGEAVPYEVAHGCVLHVGA